MRNFKSLSLFVALFLAACAEQNQASKTEPADANPERRTGIAATPPPTGHELLFEGLVTNEARAPFAALSPGVFFTLPPFPVETDRKLDNFNPLGLPAPVRRRIAAITPEIRMFGTNRGISVERRGWAQNYVARSRDGNCAVMLDFRVSVVERRLASNTTFGRIRRPFELVKVLTPPPPGRNGLYVLVIVTVEVNSKLFGRRFEENNAAVKGEREGRTPPAPVVVGAMRRWFVVEHELKHAEQIRRRYQTAVNGVVNGNTLCRPTRPVNRHKALVEQGFNTAWRELTTGGQGGDHANANYPNTPAENEARRASWDLFDARGGR